MGGQPLAAPSEGHLDDRMDTDAGGGGDADGAGHGSDQQRLPPHAANPVVDLLSLTPRSYLPG